MRYWFKPKQFGVFAGFYPVSWEGWVLTILAKVCIIVFFVYSVTVSHSWSDALFMFTPRAIIVLLVLDAFSLVKGEYPSWWKKTK